MPFGPVRRRPASAQSVARNARPCATPAAVASASLRSCAYPIAVLDHDADPGRPTTPNVGRNATVPPGPSSIHGVALISTPAMAAATAWVVEASGGDALPAGRLSVQLGHNTDDLPKNLNTMVAEERIGAAVMRPSCRTKLTLS